ncbi:MAG: hypothetical protein WC827_04020 [Candidatus Paceibacterota bacterium]|jgi:hypothetical protein
MITLLSHTQNKINTGKRLTKDDLAYELNRIGFCGLPFIVLVTFTRVSLVEAFNAKFNTNIK